MTLALFILCREYWWHIHGARARGSAGGHRGLREDADAAAVQEVSYWRRRKVYGALWICMYERMCIYSMYVGMYTMCMYENRMHLYIRKISMYVYMYVYIYECIYVSSLEVEAVTIMNVSWSADHRVIDGGKKIALYIDTVYLTLSLAYIHTYIHYHLSSCYVSDGGEVLEPVEALHREPHCHVC